MEFGSILLRLVGLMDLIPTLSCPTDFKGENPTDVIKEKSTLACI